MRGVKSITFGKGNVRMLHEYRAIVENRIDSLLHFSVCADHAKISSSPSNFQLFHPFLARATSVPNAGISSDFTRQLDPDRPPLRIWTLLGRTRKATFVQVSNGPVKADKNAASLAMKVQPRLIRDQITDHGKFLHLAPSFTGGREDSNWLLVSDDDFAKQPCTPAIPLES